MVNVAINGIGRIGKSILRYAIENKILNICAINDLNQNIENIAYSINYDSTYGQLKDKFKPIASDDIVAQSTTFAVNSIGLIQNSSSKIKIFNENSIEKIDWEKAKIDILIDASGDLNNYKIAKNVIQQNDLKAIFFTHSPNNADFTMVLGVNEEKLNPKIHKIISSSTCNATALLPVLSVLDNKFKIQGGFITTIHPLLNHQKLLDSGCIGSNDRNVSCNFEFGRSAIGNIIPTQTTTIKACSNVLPHINEELIGSFSLRSPTQTVGCIDATLFLEKIESKEKIIEFFTKLEQKQKYKIFLNNFDKLISCDFKGEEYTSIIDHRFTDIRANGLKLLIWYDNEAGYASKVANHVKIYADML